VDLLEDFEEYLTHIKGVKKHLRGLFWWECRSVAIVLYYTSVMSFLIIDGRSGFPFFVQDFRQPMLRDSYQIASILFRAMRRGALALRS